MKRISFLLFISIIIFLFLRAFFIDVIQITSPSMEPTLKVGHRYYIEKITRHFTKPKKNDIVVFPSPVMKNKSLTKRVIAIEGDTIEIFNKEVFINSIKIIEPFVYHSRMNEKLEDDYLEPLVVPQNTMFLMGDNRDVSDDSRDWIDSTTGDHIYFVNTKKIFGKLLGQE